MTALASLNDVLFAGSMALERPLPTFNILGEATKRHRPVDLHIPASVSDVDHAVLDLNRRRLSDVRDELLAFGTQHISPYHGEPAPQPSVSVEHVTSSPPSKGRQTQISGGAL